MYIYIYVHTDTHNYKYTRKCTFNYAYTVSISTHTSILLNTIKSSVGKVYVQVQSYLSCLSYLSLLVIIPYFELKLLLKMI